MFRKSTLSSMNSLALLLHAQGDYSGAVDLLRIAVAGARKTLGDGDPTTATYMASLACCLQERGGDGDDTEADALIEEYTSFRTVML